MNAAEILTGIDDLCSRASAGHVSDDEFNVRLGEFDAAIEGLTADNLDLTGAASVVRYCINRLDGDHPEVEELLQTAADCIAREAGAQ